MFTLGTRRSSSFCVVGVAGGALFLGGCEANPTAPEHSDELEVELTIEPGHVHILQTEVTYTVHVHDHHGESVTDFLALEVQRLAAGSDTWRGTDLELVGEEYVGTYMFSSSGDYQIRVAGQRPGESDLAVLYQHPEPLHAVRAHAEAGGYRVEFETFPGHIHTGNIASSRFWIMETERDADGVRPPIAGLTPQIFIAEADGSSAQYAAHEHAAGEYEADHEFAIAGDCQITVQFTGVDGQTAEAVFMQHVVHAH